MCDVLSRCRWCTTPSSTVCRIRTSAPPSSSTSQPARRPVSAVPRPWRARSGGGPAVDPPWRPGEPPPVPPPPPDTPATTSTSAASRGTWPASTASTASRNPGQFRSLMSTSVRCKFSWQQFAAATLLTTPRIFGC